MIEHERQYVSSFSREGAALQAEAPVREGSLETRMASASGKGTPRFRSAALWLGCFLFAPLFPSAAQSFDLVFRGGEVLDGTGAPAFSADVGVRDGILMAVGDLAGAKAERVVDITGKTIIPGIIDLHSHADGQGNGTGLRSVSVRRRAAPNLVSQGITTVVVNQDGRGPLDISAQRAELERLGIGPNAVLMVGHNSIRQAAMQGGDWERPATKEERARMLRILREGMDAGAWGLSAGLEYEPGIWSTTEELVGLVRAIVPYHGVYIVHERSSGMDPMWYVPSHHSPNQPTMLDSILETIAIGEETGATVVATHIKARGTNYWGSSKRIVEAIEKARARGVSIYADQYPYNSSGSDGAIVLIPRWTVDEFDPGPGSGERDYAAILRRVLADREAASRMARDVEYFIQRRGGPGQIVVFDYPQQSYVGKTLAQLGVENELSPLETVYKLQLEGYSGRRGGVRLRGFSMDESDIDTFAAKSWVATASDAGIALPEDGPVHPRFYGTFPRKLHRYALGRGVLSLEQAVRSMTALPAEILGFKRRGLIKTGYKADLAVLDLKRIRDKATFIQPHQYPEGVDYVLVNGQFVLEARQLTGALPGRVLTPILESVHLRRK